jgi:hypothetical protein
MASIADHAGRCGDKSRVFAVKYYRLKEADTLLSDTWHRFQQIVGT